MLPSQPCLDPAPCPSHQPEALPKVSGPQRPRDRETKQLDSEFGVCQPILPSDAQIPQSGPWGCLPTPATPVRHRARTGPQGGPVQSLPHALGARPGWSTLTFKGDCKGLSVYSGILLEGGMASGRVSFVVGNSPPPQLPSCQLLINCCRFTPEGCCWAPSPARARLVVEEHPQQRGARALARARARGAPPVAPALGQSCCFCAQVLTDSCAKPSVNIWEGGCLRGRREEREQGAEHPARFPLPIHQLATCSE